MAVLHSKWAIDPIDLSNPLSHPSWANPEMMDIPSGKMLFKNDNVYLYVAFDMTGDTINDPVPAPGDGDYFWLVFDRDRNLSVTSGTDVLYSTFKNNNSKLGKSILFSSSSMSGIIPETQSQCSAAFEASPNNATAHKIFKIRIKMADINIGPFPFPFFLFPYAKFGIRYHSTTPNLLVESPVNMLASFAAFNTLYFAKQPSVAPADMGPVIGSVGLIPTTKIDGVTGKATTAAGYYVPVTNAAFGSVLNLIGNRTQMQNLWAAGVTKYRILHRFGTVDPFTDLRSGWTNYQWTGSDYTLVSFGPDATDFYPMPNPLVDYSIDDLLIQFNSTGMPTGTHQFQVEFRNAANAVVATPPQTVSLFIDNAVPQVNINSISHAGVNVGRCAFVNLSSATDGIRFNITATDPEGNLLAYALTAGWGNGDSETIVAKTYDPAIMGSSWTGVVGMDVPAAPSLWTPHETCAYGFTVSASGNVTNGYGYVGYNSYTQYLTLIKP